MVQEVRFREARKRPISDREARLLTRGMKGEERRKTIEALKKTGKVTLEGKIQYVPGQAPVYTRIIEAPKDTVFEALEKERLKTPTDLSKRVLGKYQKYKKEIPPRLKQRIEEIEKKTVFGKEKNIYFTTEPLPKLRITPFAPKRERITEKVVGEPAVQSVLREASRLRGLGIERGFSGMDINKVETLDRQLVRNIGEGYKRYTKGVVDMASLPVTLLAMAPKSEAEIISLWNNRAEAWPVLSAIAMGLSQGVEKSFRDIYKEGQVYGKIFIGEKLSPSDVVFLQNQNLGRAEFLGEASAFTAAVAGARRLAPALKRVGGYVLTKTGRLTKKQLQQVARILKKARLKPKLEKIKVGREYVSIYTRGKTRVSSLLKGYTYKQKQKIITALVKGKTAIIKGKKYLLSKLSLTKIQKKILGLKEKTLYVLRKSKEKIKEAVVKEIQIIKKFKQSLINKFGRDIDVTGITYKGKQITIVVQKTKTARFADFVKRIIRENINKLKISIKGKIKGLKSFKRAVRTKGVKVEIIRYKGRNIIYAKEVTPFKRATIAVLNKLKDLKTYSKSQILKLLRASEKIRQKIVRLGKVTYKKKPIWLAKEKRYVSILIPEDKTLPTLVKKWVGRNWRKVLDGLSKGRKKFFPSKKYYLKAVRVGFTDKYNKVRRGLAFMLEEVKGVGIRKKITTRLSKTFTARLAKKTLNKLPRLPKMRRAQINILQVSRNIKRAKTITLQIERGKTIKASIYELAAAYVLTRDKRTKKTIRDEMRKISPSFTNDFIRLSPILVGTGVKARVVASASDAVKQLGSIKDLSRFISRRVSPRPVPPGEEEDIITDIMEDIITDIAEEPPSIQITETKPKPGESWPNTPKLFIVFTKKKKKKPKKPKKKKKKKKREFWTLPSLGAVLWELTTGKKPPKGKVYTTLEVRKLVVKARKKRKLSPRERMVIRLAEKRTKKRKKSTPRKTNKGKKTRRARRTKPRRRKRRSGAVARRKRSTRGSKKSKKRRVKGKKRRKKSFWQNYRL